MRLKIRVYGPWASSTGFSYAIFSIATNLGWSETYAAWTWKLCVTLFTAALRVKPDSPRAHFIVGKLHGDRGEMEQALSHLDQTLELYPDHSSALVEKGVLLGKAGDLHGALQLFEEAVRINPENGMAHLENPTVARASRWSASRSSRGSRQSRIAIGVGRAARGPSSSSAVASGAGASTASVAVGRGGPSS